MIKGGKIFIKIIIKILSALFLIFVMTACQSQEMIIDDSSSNTIENDEYCGFEYKTNDEQISYLKSNTIFESEKMSWFYMMIVMDFLIHFIQLYKKR